MSRLEQLRQLILLILQIRVSSNVLPRDENVGNSSLSRNVLKRSLDFRPVIDLVQLDGVELCAERGEQLLGGLAVGAVRLGEDGHGVVGDDAFGLGLCCGGNHGSLLAEKRSEET